MEFRLVRLRGRTAPRSTFVPKANRQGSMQIQVFGDLSLLHIMPLNYYD